MKEQQTASDRVRELEEMEKMASLLDRVTDVTMRQEAERMIMDRAQAFQWRKTPIGANQDHSQMKIAAGRAFGLDAFTSLNSFDVIQEQVAPKAVFRQARMHVVGYRVIVVEHTDEKCTLGAQFGPSAVVKSDGTPYTVTYTMADAKRAGLDSKDNYKKNPADMLWARAVTRLQKRVCPEAMLGMDLPDPSEPITLGAVVDETERQAAIKGEAAVEELKARLEAERGSA